MAQLTTKTRSSDQQLNQVKVWVIEFLARENVFVTVVYTVILARILGVPENYTQRKKHFIQLKKK